MGRTPVFDWTVDYGDGPKACRVPHAWRQDVDVRWEGPAVYRTTLEVPANGGWLLFEGVSYQARVLLDGELALVHEGIWDAFVIPLSGFAGKAVAVAVEVAKNGGETFPVRDVASGFLPYVFNTFGGIWREVWLCGEEPVLDPPAPPCRVSVRGTKIFVDGKPFYMRGVLTWGWYPELGNHPHPDDETIRREVRLMKELGFNTCKFCLWVPSHRFFEILEEEGMFAWLELPLWDPTPDPEKQEAMFEELRRIVHQYRRHSNIVAWTCGCELSSNTTAEYRRRLYEMVKELTGAALVKDNSGSSEMYGGDLREYGDFYDFHPYCDTPFYPVVLDSLLIGPREKKPILMGEFNDIDVHRDLARIKREQPFWASEDPYLNDQGVRWEKPRLPGILEESRWAKPIPKDGRWSKSRSGLIRQQLGWNSMWKADFIRRLAQQAVRSREEIAGYVITGWRDTPISTSGAISDWGDPRDIIIQGWNGPGMLFPIQYRKPPWVNGGNRPGWIDPRNVFDGAADLNIGGVSENKVSAFVDWELERHECISPYIRKVMKGRLGRTTLQPNAPRQIAHLRFTGLTEGRHMVFVKFGRLKLCEQLWVYRKPDFATLSNWGLDDPTGHMSGVNLQGGPNVVATRISARHNEALRKGACVVAILLDDATCPMPLWRECAYDWPDADPEEGPLVHWWHELYAVSGDRAIDLPALEEKLGCTLRRVKVDMLRIDTRTYAEHPILLRAKVGKGTLVATTLRPFGGLGVQPYGVMNNPAGANLLVKLIEMAERRDGNSG